MGGAASRRVEKDIVALGHGRSALGRRPPDAHRERMEAAIIAIHGVLSCAGTIDVWTYTQAREATLAPAGSPRAGCCWSPPRCARRRS
jgi:hypothetical protein